MRNPKQKIVYAVAILLVGGALAAGLMRARRAGSAELQVRPLPGKPGRFAVTFPAMGTDVRLVAAAPDAATARRYFQAARRPIQRTEELMSTYRPDSEISRLNRSGSAELSREVADVLRRAAEISALTRGAFDVTYAPLRDVWRHGADNGELPPEAELEEARGAVDWRGLGLRQSSPSVATLEREGMQVDLGGIAKGYAIDRAAEAMRAAGAESGLVDIGGDLRLIGRPTEREKWRIQVRRPPDQAEDYVLELGPVAVATSGDYARGFRVDGEWYSHIIDPRTGRPVRHAASVTVVAADAMTADALATAFSVMRPEEAVKTAEDLPSVECMLMVRREGGELEEFATPGFMRLIDGGK
jgi:thiamine biosynthesis lipoprotein